MRILALDISKRATGAAVGDGSCAPHSFLFSPGGGSLGETGAAFVDFLRDAIVVNQPDLIAVEASFTAPRDTGHQQRLAHGLVMLAHTMATTRATPILEFAAATWRKHFLGSGYPIDPKKAAVRMCGILGWDVGGSHDRAEACGVWACAHLRAGNRPGLVKLLSFGSVRRLAADG